MENINTKKYRRQIKAFHTWIKHSVGQSHLVSEMLDDEGAVGHAWLLKQGAGFQMGVVQFLSPGVV